jgi:hypothetical protein
MKKDRYHVVISVDAEKAFDKVQYPFVIKMLSKLSIHAQLNNFIKAIIRNKEKLKLSKIWNTAKMPTFTPCLQYSIRSSSQRNHTRESNEGHPNWKR